MLDRDHVIVSETALMCYEDVARQPIGSVVLPCAMGIFLGSQLPDMDRRSSHINHVLRPLSFLFSCFGHRGFWHSIWAILIFSFGIYYLNPLLQNSCRNYFPISSPVSNFINMICWGLIIGFILHIIEDAFSRGGVIWFFPFPSHSYKYFKQGGQKIYYRTNINKTFRYRTQNKGGERIIRYISFVLLIVAITIRCLMIGGLINV